MNFEAKSLRGTNGATARVALPAIAAVALILASCGGGDSGLTTQAIDDLPVVSAAATIESTVSSAPPVTVAVPATTAALPATVPPPTALPTAPLPLPADDGLNPLGGNSPEDLLMPAVVCMNLQEAQDEIQDHGVFLSGSEDATGQGRMQINDSNWLVVGQSPDAGVPISEGEAVLFVVKYDDDYPAPC